jgi:hypothetical protein
VALRFLFSSVQETVANRVEPASAGSIRLKADPAEEQEIEP